MLANAPKPAQGATAQRSAMQDRRRGTRQRVRRSRRAPNTCVAGASPEPCRACVGAMRVLTRLVHSDATAEAAYSAASGAGPVRGHAHVGQQRLPDRLCRYRKLRAARVGPLSHDRRRWRQRSCTSWPATRASPTSASSRKIATLEKSALPALTVKFLVALGKVTEVLHTSTLRPRRGGQHLSLAWAHVVDRIADAASHAPVRLPRCRRRQARRVRRLGDARAIRRRAPGAHGRARGLRDLRRLAHGRDRNERARVRWRCCSVCSPTMSPRFRPAVRSTACSAVRTVACSTTCSLIGSTPSAT